ncbi:hypothetical protein [Pilimelia columellifera]|uniref:Uncharacterized protein n=1 Tax=Pilimelia columellifera subsp. columellifera TaxID=706583 RepID=A0ABN3NFE9_9ACTN
MNTEHKRRVPNPLYAAAGAGDLAYQQLRRHVPTIVAELRESATALRERATNGELEAVRADVRTVLSHARERANAVYRELVERGEQVVGHASAPRSGSPKPAKAKPRAPKPAQAKAQSSKPGPKKSGPKKSVQRASGRGHSPAAPAEPAA